MISSVLKVNYDVFLEKLSECVFLRNEVTRSFQMKPALDIIVSLGFQLLG